MWIYAVQVIIKGCVFLSQGGPVILKCKENGDVAKMNGFSDYSRQNGGAAQSLLNQQKLNENETTVAFKVQLK